MKKLYIEVIDRCYDCPNMFEDEGDYVCSEVNFTQYSPILKHKTDEYGTIPKWCSLSNYIEGRIK